MNNNNRWRLEQIAITILYRYFGNVSINKEKDGLCDFIVTCHDEMDFRFGVVVRNNSFEQTEHFDSLIDALYQTDFTKEVNRMPIVALYVDEIAENAKIAFLVGWRFGEPHIFRDFELRSLTAKGADICLQIIKSMDSTIRLLSENNLNVLKRIVFSRKSSENRNQEAEILYFRKLSPSYRMNTAKIVDERERIERMVKGTPENEYPNDDLDRLIFNAVKRQFKNAKVCSKLLLFSTELDDLQLYKKMHCHKTSLLVSPDMQGLSTTEVIMLNGLELFSLELEVYVENIFYKNAFDGISFDAEEPIEGWSSKLNEWNMMKETMKPISVFFR